MPPPHHATPTHCSTPNTIPQTSQVHLVVWSTEASWCHIVIFSFRFANFKVGKINFKVGKINFKVGKINFKVGKINFNVDKINFKVGKINFNVGKINFLMSVKSTF